MAKDNKIETFEEDAPAVKTAPASSATEQAKKPYGQNPGDIVDQAQAVGGSFEHIGGGKYRRLA